MAPVVCTPVAQAHHCETRGHQNPVEWSERLRQQARHERCGKDGCAHFANEVPLETRVVHWSFSSLWAVRTVPPLTASSEGARGYGSIDRFPW